MENITQVHFRKNDSKKPLPYNILEGKPQKDNFHNHFLDARTS